MTHPEITVGAPVPTRCCSVLMADDGRENPPAVRCPTCGCGVTYTVGGDGGRIATGTSRGLDWPACAQ